MSQIQDKMHQNMDFFGPYFEGSAQELLLLLSTN